jgi:hypothetical protein
MGQVPMDGEKPAPGAARYGALFGSSGADGKKLRTFGVSFASTPDGAPAFVRWLSDQGCSDFRYELRSAAGELGLDDLEEEP